MVSYNILLQVTG